MIGRSTRALAAAQSELDSGQWAAACAAFAQVICMLHTHTAKREQPVEASLEVQRQQAVDGLARCEAVGGLSAAACGLLAVVQPEPLARGPLHDQLLCLSARLHSATTAELDDVVAATVGSRVPESAAALIAAELANQLSPTAESVQLVERATLSVIRAQVRNAYRPRQLLQPDCI